MDFLKAFEKDIAKIDGVTGSSTPPRYYYGAGNYCINRIMTGSFYKCVPQGRLVGLMGPSASGKSFMLGNLAASAQKSGAYLLIVDSENAFDDDFASAIGIDIDNNYNYKSVVTIAHAQKVISSFLIGYKKEYGDDPNAPQIVIALDSLDMLLTDTELVNYGKGVSKGDQGQRNKQLKAMLRTFVQDIKNINVTMIVTGQVYRNQDQMNGEGVWIVSDAVRYSLSQIMLLTKLKLKDDRVVEGIRMKVEGYKTRFTKPFQTVTVEVPYDKGMDPYSGLLEAAEALGVVLKKGSRWQFGDNPSFYAKDVEKHAEDILVKCETLSKKFLDVAVEEEADFDGTSKDAELTKAKRVKKAVTELKLENGFDEGGLDDQEIN